MIGPGSDKKKTKILITHYQSEDAIRKIHTFFWASPNLNGDPSPRPNCFLPKSTCFFSITSLMRKGEGVPSKGIIFLDICPFVVREYHQLFCLFFLQILFFLIPSLQEHVFLRSLDLI